MNLYDWDLSPKKGHHFLSLSNWANFEIKMRVILLGLNWSKGLKRYSSVFLKLNESHNCGVGSEVINYSACEY